MTEAFLNALNTGKVVVRKAWKNINSEKDQVSVQFMQKIKSPAAVGNTLVAIAQGVGDGTQKVTALLSFAADQFENLFGQECPEDGLNYYEMDVTPPIASEVMGVDVNIEVKENTDPNEYNSEGEVSYTMNEDQAKVNPQTGKKLTKGGDLIYRHTQIKVGEANHTFVQHDTASKAKAQPEAEEEVLAAGANG